MLSLLYADSCFLSLTVPICFLDSLINIIIKFEKIYVLPKYSVFLVFWGLFRSFPMFVWIFVRKTRQVMANFQRRERWF